MNTKEQGFRPEAADSEMTEAAKPAANLADLENAADKIGALRDQMKANEKRRKQLKKKPGFLRDASEKLALDGGLDESNQELEQQAGELKHMMETAKPGMTADVEELLAVKAELAGLKKKGNKDGIKDAEKRLAAIRAKYDTAPQQAPADELLKQDWGEEAAAAQTRQELLRADWGAEAEPRAEESVEIDLSDLELDMELAQAEKEFEPQVRAAEREIADASEAFVKTINELLSKIEKTPLGAEMRGAIEGSPDNIRLKAAIAKLDGLRKERAALKDAVASSKKYPEELFEPVTEDMIIGYEEPAATVQDKERLTPPPLPAKERQPLLPELPEYAPEPDDATVRARIAEMSRKAPDVEPVSQNLPPPPPIDALREAAGQPPENELGLSALRNASDVDSLKAAVTTLGRIESDKGKVFSAAEINERIDQAVKFPVLLKFVTRANGLRDKVRELIDASRKEQQAELKADYAAEVAKSDDLTAPEKKEAAAIVEKNELPPERRAALEAEIAMLQNQLFDIQKGAILIDKETGKEVDKPGLEELEKKLASLGVNADELLEKKAVSGWERFKFGLKALVKPELDRTLKQYQERLSDRIEAQDNLQLARLELKNPRKYAILMQQRLIRTLGASASIRARQNSSSGTGVLTMKF